MSRVVDLHAVTTVDMDPEKVLRAAIENIPETAVVIGYDREGELYLSSTTSDKPMVLWLLEEARRELFDLSGDGE